MKNYRKWAGYILYVIVLAVLFLYICFPSDSAEQYVESLISRHAPGVELSISSLGLGFPPSVVINNVDIRYRRAEPVNLERITISPAYLKLLRGVRSFRIDGDAAGGKIEGDLALPDPSGNSGNVSARFDFHDLEIGSFHILETMGRGEAAGRMEGEIDYTGDLDGSGSGNAALDVRECRIQLDPAPFGVKELAFKAVQAVMELEQRRLKISRFSLDGTQFSGTGSGTLRLSAPIESSRINLSGDITLHPPLLRSIGGILPEKFTRKGGLPIRITGTLGRPGFSVR
ncbi:MAG: type II secretion system protein GspN [Desulfobacteraceae bacterium]|nr:type II secretion system protein GspN [Desulfobacteraceae bacterium]